MSEADQDQWREQFQEPDAAELDGREIPSPPTRCAGLAGVGGRPLAHVHRQLTRLSLSQLVPGSLCPDTWFQKTGLRAGHARSQNP
jgi:hypothetical protein